MSNPDWAPKNETSAEIFIERATANQIILESIGYGVCFIKIFALELTSVHFVGTESTDHRSALDLILSLLYTTLEDTTSST